MNHTFAISRYQKILVCLKIGYPESHGLSSFPIVKLPFGGILYIGIQHFQAHPNGRAMFAMATLLGCIPAKYAWVCNLITWDILGLGKPKSHSQNEIRNQHWGFHQQKWVDHPPKKAMV